MITVGKLLTLLHDTSLTISFDRNHQFHVNSDDRLMLAPFLSFVVETIDATNPAQLRLDILMEPGQPVAQPEEIISAAP